MHSAHQVHLQHTAEIVQFHFGKGLVAQNARVVDQYIDLAPALHHLRHHGLHGAIVGHRRMVGHGGAAQRFYVSNHLLCGRRTALPVQRAARVIHHHLGPTFGQRQRVFTAQATACARHNGHSIVEIQTHTLTFWRRDSVPSLLKCGPHRGPFMAMDCTCLYKRWPPRG